MNCKKCTHPYDVLEVSHLCHRCADKHITDVESRASQIVETAREIYKEVAQAVRIDHEHGEWYTSAVGIRLRAKALGEALLNWDALKE